MRCAARRCEETAAAVVVQGDVVSLACELHAAAAELFDRDAAVRDLRRRSTDRWRMRPRGA